jgi:hypothetical protein
MYGSYTGFSFDSLPMFNASLKKKSVAIKIFLNPS